MVSLHGYNNKIIISLVHLKFSSHFLARRVRLISLLFFFPRSAFNIANIGSYSLYSEYGTRSNDEHTSSTLLRRHYYQRTWSKVPISNLLLSQSIQDPMKSTCHTILLKAAFIAGCANRMNILPVMLAEWGDTWRKAAIFQCLHRHSTNLNINSAFNMINCRHSDWRTFPLQFYCVRSALLTMTQNITTVNVLRIWRACTHFKHCESSRLELTVRVMLLTNTQQLFMQL